MKDFRHSLLVFLSAATLTYAASAPVMDVMDVMVSNSAGKLLYQAKTDARGTFATPILAPGSYVVQFSSKSSLQGGPFTLVVSAGKKKVVADSVPAGKFSKGGVAMKVDMTRGMTLTGQVAEAGAVTTDTKSNGKVKYINGKKYVWVPSELGSYVGGRWVEAGTPAARNVQNAGQDALRDLQGRSQLQPVPGSGGN